MHSEKPGTKTKDKVSISKAPYKRNIILTVLVLAALSALAFIFLQIKTEIYLHSHKEERLVNTK